MPTHREKIYVVNFRNVAEKPTIENQERLISRLEFVGCSTEQAHEILRVVQDCLRPHRNRD